MSPSPVMEQESALLPDGKVKLLLVDDNPDNLVSLEAVLESLNQELILAHSGAEALRLVLEHDFAAVLLDVKMPDIDGLETAELMRSRKRSRLTPIIFMTGYRDEEQLFRGYDLGAVDYLFKPIVPQVLRSKVSVFVELARTAQVQREQSAHLEKMERKFRELLEATPDAMVITRDDGQIVLVNSRAESQFGYTRPALLDRNIRGLVEGWSCHMAEESPSRQVECTGLRADGGQFPAAVTFSPLQTEEGKLVISAIRDITESKQYEESIHRLNAELESRVVERTAALVRANEQLTQFAYAASHDLQEPLRMVISFTQLLAEHYKGKLDPSADRFIDYAVQGAFRMDEMLNALRDYLQAAETTETDAPVEVDVNVVLKKAMLNLESAISSSGASIEAFDLPVVVGYEGPLVQLFQNLLANAIKYRSQAPPRIRIFCKRIDDECTFSVEDNGLGIEPKYFSRIFGMFKRLHGKEYPGTGIGLTICTKVVERHGGRIWVESEQGRGSTFRFAIPNRKAIG